MTGTPPIPPATWTAALIPEQVRKSLSATEILDRCVEAERLSRLASQATDPVEAKGYSRIAKAVLEARPHAEVEQERQALIRKAAAMGGNAAAADQLRRRAEQLKADNPVAPQRGKSAAVAKAGLPVAVYNDRRRLFGLVDRQAIKQQVTKADGGNSRMVALYDAKGCLCGVADPDDITPVDANAGGGKPDARPESGYADAAPAPVGKARAPVRQADVGSR